MSLLAQQTRQAAPEYKNIYTILCTVKSAAPKAGKTNSPGLYLLEVILKYTQQHVRTGAQRTQAGLRAVIVTSYQAAAMGGGGAQVMSE